MLSIATVSALFGAILQMRYKNEDLESEVEDGEEAEGVKPRKNKHKQKKKPKKSKAWKSRKRKLAAKMKNKKDKPAVSRAPVTKAKLGAAKAEKAKTSKGESGAPFYNPGAFKDARVKFISETRAAKNVSYQDANQLWMQSAERAKMLEGMPMSELIRRRFVKPAKSQSKNDSRP